MFTTLYQFCNRYGASRFAELIQLLNDPTQTHASIGKRFEVSPSCVTRWQSKFCDVTITLKLDVLDFLESHYNLQADALAEERSIIESERGKLRLIRGTKREKHGRTATQGQDTDT